MPLGKVRVEPRKRNGMKGQIPSRKPRIFPLVGHRKDIGRVHLLPSLVARVGAALKFKGHFGVAFEPFVYVVIIKLFVPQHTRKSLTLNILQFGGNNIFLQTVVKLVGFALAQTKNFVKIIKRILQLRLVRKPQSNGGAFSGRDGLGVFTRYFRADVVGVYSLFFTLYHVIVDAVFWVQS